MASKFTGAGTYMVVAVTTVYANSKALERRGSYYAGSTIKISGSTYINGLQYGIIDSGQTAGFEGYTRTFKNPTGCVIQAVYLLPKIGAINTPDTSVPTVTKNTLDINHKNTMDVWVKSGYTCTVWGDPTDKLTTVGTKKSGEKMHIYGTAAKGGRTFGFINASCTQCIILYTFNTTNLAQYLTTSMPDKVSNDYNTGTVNASQSAYNSLNNVTPTGANGPPITVTDAANVDTDDYDVAALSERITAMRFNMIDTDAESLRALANMKSVLGTPPMLPFSTDPKYVNGVDFGRTYAEMFLMNNCIFSILPCKVKYLAGFSQEKKKGFLDLVTSGISDFQEDSDIATTANQMGLSGQLFEAVQDFNKYINTVNLLARVFAIYLGIGDKPCPGTNTAYKNADYTFYRRASGGGSSLFGSVSGFASSMIETLVTKAISDDSYTHFYMTADGTSMSDSMSVSTASSSLEGLFNNGLSELGREIQFLMGGEVDETFVNDLLKVGDSLGSSLASAGGPIGALGNMFRYGANYLRGGRLVFPQMLDDCTYDRSYTGSCRFISPSGDPEARFMNCYLPLCFLLPYVLPQMISDNMYTYPFVCKVDVPGQVHCDLAAMTGLRIQRGGPDGQSWTVDGLPFEIDVTFDITPLYSKLMVTNTLHPILFMSNTALHEYMASMAGVSFTGDELTLKMKIASALFDPANVAKNTIDSLFRSYYDSGVANALRWVFNF